MRFRDPQRIYRLSAVRVYPRTPYANDMATGYSVPTSERDTSSADVSASSGSCTAVQGPMKKVKPMLAEGAGDGGSCTLPRERKNNNFPALAATTSSAATVKIHGQTQSSSDSSVSETISSSSRQRRAKLAAARIAAARVALAEARLAEIEADADLFDDASMDSISRRNADVLCDPGDDEPHLQVQAENAYGQQVSPTSHSERTESASTPTPSIYDDFRQRVGNTTQDDVFSLDNTFPRVLPQRSTFMAEAGSIPQTISDLQGSPTTEVVTFSSTQGVDVDTPMNGIGLVGSPVAEAAAAMPTYILNHIVNNHDGCNYGHIV